MAWKSKIVGHGRVAASELVANPANHRKHPNRQKRVVGASIAEIGFVKSVIVNKTTGLIVDGHERVEQALAVGPATLVDVEYVELTPEDERKALLVLDASSELAELDSVQLNALVADCAFDLGALTELAVDMLRETEPKPESDGDLGAADPEEPAFDPLAVLGGPLELVPSSVLNAREGTWQSRKRAWLALGIRSDAGRGVTKEELGDKAKQTTGGLLIQSWTGHPDFYKQKTKVEEELGVQLSTAEFQEKYFVIPDDVLSSGTSVFDPVLCEALYRWFAPAGGVVLDPFAGGSVRGVVAALLGRSYVGCDLRSEQIAENVAQWEALLSQKVLGRGVDAVAPVWHVTDSAKIDVVCAGVEADFLFSCPPYADLEVYSNDPADLSNMSYADFVAVYRTIIARSAALLKNNRFAVFVVGEVRGPDGAYYNFVGDTVQAFLDAGLRLHSEAALVTSVGSLPIRVGRQFSSARKLGKTHQNVLVFVKGDPVEAARVVVESELPKP